MTSSEHGSGSDGLAGYDYQVDVSVWLALDLVVNLKFSSELVLEPASQEDLEGDLEEFEPGRVNSISEIGTYKLVVQAKLRNGDNWSADTIKSLLLHGKRRDSVAKRLADPSIRYLLVTSVGLNGPARGMRTRRAGSWPAKGQMPKSIEAVLPAGSDGRVGIFTVQDEERLRSHLRRLLTETFRVPFANLDRCCDELRAEAMNRIRGALHGKWARDDIEAVLRRHEGLLAGSDHYVKPQNWGELREMMRTRHAAILVGQSGTGKTMATNQLYDELRIDIPGLKRVHVTKGPYQIQRYIEPGPVLFDIEDPWGRYSFSPDSREWDQELLKHLRSAGGQRLLIVTSRRDMMESGEIRHLVKNWEVPLEAESYGTAERSTLYKNRIGDIPRYLQELAEDSEGKVLLSLRTPYEIQKFFDALPEIAQKIGTKNPSRLLTDAIKQAHHESIELTVVSQIEAREEIEQSVVIWALLKANGRLTTDVIVTLDQSLAERSDRFDQPVSQLMSFLISARNLRQVETVVTYYHPRVEAGLERVLKKHSVRGRKAIGALVECLVSAFAGEQWGARTAARVIESVEPKRRPLNLSGAARSAIDAWLDSALTDEPDFKEFVRIAAAAGSTDCAIAEVARFVMNVDLTREPYLLYLEYWVRPARSEDWYASIRTDSRAARAIERFVNEVIVRSRRSFPKQMALDLLRMHPGIGATFLKTAESIVDYGVVENSEIIAQGALQQLERFESIVDLAVHALDTPAAELDKWRQIRLDIQNRVYSDDYADHLQENDDGYTANEFLRAYVDKVRSTSGWSALTQHRHFARLRAYWLQALARDWESKHDRSLFRNGSGEVEHAVDTENLNEEELQAATSSAFDSDDEVQAWNLLSKQWLHGSSGRLRDRLLTGSSKVEVRFAALRCALSRDVQELVVTAEKLIEKNNMERLVELATDIAGLRQSLHRNEDDRLAVLHRVVAALPSPLSGIAAFAMTMNEGALADLKDHELETLKSVTGTSQEVAALRLWLDSVSPVSVDENMSAVLATCDDEQVVLLALRAAARRGMGTVVEAAIGHRFAAVAAEAIRLVSDSHSGRLPDSVLAMRNTKAKLIKEALIKEMSSRQNPAHAEVLLDLVEDEWSASSGVYGPAHQYVIARAALPALLKQGELGQATEERLLHVASNTDDSYLAYLIMRSVLEAKSADSQQRVLEAASTPEGKAQVAAAEAIAGSASSLLPEIVAKLSPALLLQQGEATVAELVFALALMGGDQSIRAAASAIASVGRRRVLLLLMYSVLSERGEAGTADFVATLVPGGKSFIENWLSSASPKGQSIESLGSPRLCSRVAEILTR